MRVDGKTLKVAEYFLFDPFSKVLEGYELDVLRGEYSQKEPDAEARLHSRRLGLVLGLVTRTTHPRVGRRRSEAGWCIATYVWRPSGCGKMTCEPDWRRMTKPAA